MLFNGIDLEPYFRIKDIRGRGLIKRRINSVSVPGMDGEHPSSIETPAKLLEVDIRIISKNLRVTVDELNGILATDEPVPIVFPDEPDMTYYGTVEDTVETGEKVHLGRHDTTIYIRRSDPKKYGPEQTAQFPLDIVAVENSGTAEAKPIFELEVLKPVTFAMIQNQNDEYMMIGQPVDADSMVFEREELILHDTCSTTTGWTVDNEVEGGIVAGTMVSDGSSFIASDYGSGSGWHGPAIKKSLSEPLDNFRMEFLIEQFGIYANEVGNVQFELLDVNNNVIGSIRMRDANTGIRLNEANAQAGSFEDGRLLIANDSGNRQATWAHFKGMLRLQRSNNRWQAYVALIDENGNHHSTMTRPFEDTQGLYAAQVAQVRVHVATSKEYAPTQQKINDIKVYKLNERDGIPYIANSGDIITFDHVDENILINGESIFGEESEVQKDFGADYFKLTSGNNKLIVLPENSFNTRVRFRERYR